MRQFITRTIIAYALILPLTCFAAQDAVITVDLASIYERPNAKSKVIETQNAGAKIRISQTSKDGWYKTRTKAGQFGWIWQADLTMLAHTAEMLAVDINIQGKQTEKRRDKKGPFYFLRAGGLSFLLMAPEVSRRTRAESGAIYPTLGAFFEFSAKLAEDLRGAFRVAFYSGSRSLTHQDPNTQLTTEYISEHSGVPVLLGLDYDFFTREDFQISGGFYAGLNFSNTTTITTKVEAPNSASFRTNAPAFLLNFSAKYWFAHRVSAVGELGFFLTQPSTSSAPSGFNGDAVLRNADGTMNALRAYHLGPMINLGLQIAL